MTKLISPQCGTYCNPSTTVQTCRGVDRKKENWKPIMTFFVGEFHAASIHVGRQDAARVIRAMRKGS